MPTEIKEGQPFPSEGLRTADGAAAQLRGPAVVYFYPKAFTPGCETETRAFALLESQFGDAGVSIAGASLDQSEEQAAFATECGATFPMLTDADGEVSKQLGIFGSHPGFGTFSRRVTFLLDRDLNVNQVWELERGDDLKAHVDEVLSAAQTLTS